jgi:Skp family chaperone for outer membrane proteins
MRFSRFAPTLVTTLACAAGLSLTWHAATGSSQTTTAAVPNVAKVATVDILVVVERMVISEEFRTDREKFFADTDKDLQPIIAEIQALEVKAKDLKPDSPELPAMNEQYQKKGQEYQQARRSADQTKERFSTTQVSKAYAKSIAAAREMAISAGYTHVIASRTGELNLRSDNVAGAVQEILARPALLSPAEDDITQKLLTQLGLDKVQPTAVPTAIPTENVPVATPATTPGEPTKK